MISRASLARIERIFDLVRRVVASVFRRVSCFKPLSAWRSEDRGPSGKRLITFDHSKAVGLKFVLPCGQCTGCRLERSRQWAMRCMHEASLYDDNCFITLTYNNEHLPADGSLKVKHFQDFMKRLRARFAERRIRFFHCGEYGVKYRRPHYHAALFNFDFTDKVLFKIRNGHRLYTSEDLASVWKLGFSSVGSLTFESAAYVARYIMKKVTGDPAKDHYFGVHSETGELVELAPEYTTMSRRPGIARAWYERFRADVFPGDDVILRGVHMKPPRYYNCLFEREDPLGYERVRSERSFRGKDCTPDRLRVREICKDAQLALLHRSGDHEA